MVFSGLLIDFAKAQNASVIIRGLRAVSDFEFEFQMANMNRHLGPGIETILVMTKEGYNYTSSSLVKQVAEYGADVSEFVPSNVVKALKAKLGQHFAGWQRHRGTRATVRREEYPECPSYPNCIYTQ